MPLLTRALLPLALAGSLLAAPLPALAAPTAPDPTVGAPGAGDPYFPRDGNGGYDVSHYDVDLTSAPATGRLRAVTTVSLTTTQALSRFDLDLRGLTVDDVTVDGLAATWERQGQELRVTPAVLLPSGTDHTVVVRYHGRPGADVDVTDGGWLRTGDGSIVVGEPHSTASFVPVSEHPSDPATFTAHVTAPSDRQVISNGTLESSVDHGDTTTSTWSTQVPMASYLFTVGIGRYATRTYQRDGLTFRDAVDRRSDSRAIQRSLAREPAVLRFLETIAGPYPYTEAGGIVDEAGFGFSLETQTRPVYAPSFFQQGPNTSVVAHELAHQWYGDLVPLRRWSSVWLNEGFATYLQYLWNQHEGWGSPRSQLRWTYHWVGSRWWRLQVGDPGPRHLFDYQVYARGAMALEALRVAVGDDTFFRILRDWPAERAGKPSTTATFVRFAERESGQQLGGLFRLWLKARHKPPFPGPETPGTSTLAHTLTTGSGTHPTRVGRPPAGFVASGPGAPRG